MKRLTTTLYIIIWFYIISGIIGIIGTIGDSYNLISKYPINSDLTEIFFSLLKLGFIAYVVYHFFMFSKTVKRFEEKSFFNIENGTSFKTMGKAIILFIIINFISSIVYTTITKSEIELARLPFEFLANTVLLMMALFLLIISHLIKNGYQLKKENDLTI